MASSNVKTMAMVMLCFATSLATFYSISLNPLISIAESPHSFSKL